LSLTSENIAEVMAGQEGRFQPPFMLIRKVFLNGRIPKDVATLASRYLPLDTMIWYYEDLQCEAVEDRIDSLLSTNPDALSFGYGKILERIMYFQDLRPAPPKFVSNLIKAGSVSIAKAKALRLPSPVVISGDASGSMETAIKTANIIGSMICLLTNANNNNNNHTTDLVYFNNGLIPCPGEIPTDIEGVLRISKIIKAGGGTNPAASLYPYYSEKKMFDCFVIVTDEEENDKVEDMNFATLFAKYREEVNSNASIIFISFLRDPNHPGQMVRDLANIGIEPLYQLRLNVNEPDLTRLEGFLGRIASEREEMD